MVIELDQIRVTTARRLCPGRSRDTVTNVRRHWWWPGNELCSGMVVFNLLAIFPSVFRAVGKCHPTCWERWVSSSVEHTPVFKHVLTSFPEQEKHGNLLHVSTLRKRAWELRPKITNDLTPHIFAACQKSSPPSPFTWVKEDIGYL